MTLNIDQYREYVVNKRKFTQSPSEYTMTVVGAETITCYPDSFLLPGRNFVNTPFSYYGPELTFPLRREYNELSVNFIVYQDWEERGYFERWSDYVIPSQNKGKENTVYDSAPEKMDSSLIFRDILLTFNTRALNNSNSNACTFYFSYCYPLLITPTNFSSDNSGYTVFTVNFAIQEYKMLTPAYDSTSNITDKL